MPKAMTVDEIEREMELLGNSNPRKKGQLKTRLVAALKKEVETLRATSVTTASSAEPTTGTMGSSTEFDQWDMELPKDPLKSDEWAFIEKACAEMTVDVRAGTATGLVKHIFNLMDAKTKAYRITKRIVERIGVGEDWPQFPALGLDAKTGKPLHDHSVMHDDWVQNWSEPKPEPVQAAPAPQPAETTEAGAPIRPTPQASEMDAFAASVADSVLGDLSTRPDPQTAAK